MEKITKKPRRRSLEDTDRLNLKLPSELKKWVVDYAQRRGTSVTQLVIDHLVSLKQLDDEEMSRDAEQI